MSKGFNAKPMAARNTVPSSRAFQESKSLRDIASREEQSRRKLPSISKTQKQSFKAIPRGGMKMSYEGVLSSPYGSSNS